MSLIYLQPEEVDKGRDVDVDVHLRKIEFFKVGEVERGTSRDNPLAHGLARQREANGRRDFGASEDAAKEIWTS